VRSDRRHGAARDGPKKPARPAWPHVAELAQYVAPKRKAIEHSGDALGLEALLARLDG
jgi:hypothetical protein